MRNKGKVHPFTSSSSSSSSSSQAQNDAAFPVLNLLPAVILTLVSVLSRDDREVLAYMITRSLKSTNPPFFPSRETKKRSKKQSVSDRHGHNSPPFFDCDCFDCYTSFWFRWDSSPNRELIHQAIEAFEEHLISGEKSEKKSKRREKWGRRKSGKLSGDALGIAADGSPGNEEAVGGATPENEAAAAEDRGQEGEAKDNVAASPPSTVVRGHRGLARKMLPDVMGILNSRLWSLWSPNV